jgi:isopenicillin N synthase-like dioxygenase
VGAFLEKRASAAATAREIEKACREFGFFYATGHSQRRRLAEAIMRKGVSPPSLEQCRQHKLAWPSQATDFEEIIGWLRQR